MVTATFGLEARTFAHRRSLSGKQTVIRCLGMACSYIALAAGYSGVAMAAAATASSSDAASASAAGAPEAVLPDTTPDQKVPVEEIVVNGVRQKDTVLPTRMKSNSVYGLDLDIMDTPRNSTLISSVQLDTIGLRDVRAFSYLTASSYTGAGYGDPDVPYVRGQASDIFFNGMRSSFTNGGYGAPLTFNSVDTVDITKGPASVSSGPGPGVGGSANLLTKRPNMTQFKESASATFDNWGMRRWNADASVPLINDTLAARLSYSGEYSNEYFFGSYYHQEALYGAVRWTPPSNYSLDFNAEYSFTGYTSIDGLNRVTQNLIDHGQYLTGAPSGELYSSLVGIAPLQVGSPGNPYSPAAPILTVLNLGPTVNINKQINIDENPESTAASRRFSAQLIQKLDLDGGTSIDSNTFFEYLERDNQASYYYADAVFPSYTIETKLDAKGKTSLPVSLGGSPIGLDWIVGGDFRFQHVNYVVNYNDDTYSIYDLTSSPSLWVASTSSQILAGNETFISPFGRTLYGTGGRANGGGTGVSDLYDAAPFFETRFKLTPELGLLLGGRVDMLKAHSHDPFDGPGLVNGLPQDHTTKAYWLPNANSSLTYRFTPSVSAYVTADLTETVNQNGGDGGINLYGQLPDHVVMRADSHLYETGMKFDLLNKKLFIGTALFDEVRQVATGPGGTQTLKANIRGFESEATYQPSPKLYATFSYSYIKSTTNAQSSFYNYAFAPGMNVDGAGLFAVFKGNNFALPGIPEQIGNVLVNYKFDDGIGVRFGTQVTGPVLVTGQGTVDLTQSLFVPDYVVANGGVYKAPQIPWQYTMNTAIFYETGPYTITGSIYNLTNRLNWQPGSSYNGTDSIVRNKPRTFEIRVAAKF